MLKPRFGCHVILIHLIINVMDFSPLPDRGVLGQPADLLQPFSQMLDGLTTLHGGDSATPLHPTQTPDSLSSPSESRESRQHGHTVHTDPGTGHRDADIRLTLNEMIILMETIEIEFRRSHGSHGSHGATVPTRSDWCGVREVSFRCSESFSRIAEATEPGYAGTVRLLRYRCTR